MTIDRWINTTSNIKMLQVPKQIKEDSIDYVESCNEVLGFILDGYEITNNEKDRIQSSYSFNCFKLKTNTKMLSSKFKDDMVNIPGVSFKKMKNDNFFIGLKEKSEMIEEIDE